MERQEIFNILQNFNLPKNKKDIITDLILNNKGNNSNNNNIGNSNIIDLSNIDMSNIDTINPNDIYEQAGVGIIYISLEDGKHHSKSYIQIGNYTQYIVHLYENNIAMAIFGFHIDGEENMNFDDYNNEAINLISTNNVNINYDEVKYVLDYLKKYTIFNIADGSSNSTTYSYIANIYGFILPIEQVTNLFVFPIGIGISLDNYQIGINNNSIFKYEDNKLSFITPTISGNFDHVFSSLNTK